MKQSDLKVGGIIGLSVEAQLAAPAYRRALDYSDMYRDPSTVWRYGYWVRERVADTLARAAREMVR